MDFGRFLQQFACWDRHECASGEKLEGGLFLITHMQMEERCNRNKERTGSKEGERSIFPSVNKRQSSLTDDRRQSETAHYYHAERERHGAHHYQDGSAGDKKEPVQRRKSDFYKGGAELEYGAQMAELQFDFQNSDGWDPDLLYEGIKGVSFDRTLPDRMFTESVMLKGNNWNLTVELMGFNRQKMMDEKKTPITLELIIGGTTGTKLSELPDAADEAAETIARLNEAAGKQLTFQFDAQVFQTVADNIIRHQASHAERKMKVIETKYPSLYREYGLHISDSSQLIQKIDEICGQKEPVKRSIEPIQKEADKVVVPEVPPSLSDPVLSVPPPPPEVCKILKMIREDLEKKNMAERLKETSQFSMIVKANLPKMKLSEVDWGLQVTLGIPINEIPGVIEKLLKVTKARTFSAEESPSTVSKEELEYQFHQKCGPEQEHEPFRQGRDMADRDSCLGGLAEIISAYRRSLDNDANAGPKHAMRLVNKNPLDQVIMSVQGLTPEEKRRLLDLCVDMIVSGKDGSGWNWVDVKLEVSEWSQKMKADQPVDLVSVYDGAYRHGQIGQLSSLNENEEGAQMVPVFEFRELSSIKLNMLADLFQAVAAYCDEPDPAEPRTAEEI